MDIHMSTDDEVLEDFYDIVANLFLDSFDSTSIGSELMNYKHKEGKFSSNFIQKFSTKQSI